MSKYEVQFAMVTDYVEFVTFLGRKESIGISQTISVQTWNSKTKIKLDLYVYALVCISMPKCSHIYLYSYNRIVTLKLTVKP